MRAILPISQSVSRWEGLSPWSWWHMAQQLGMVMKWWTREWNGRQLQMAWLLTTLPIRPSACSPFFHFFFGHFFSRIRRKWCLEYLRASEEILKTIKSLSNNSAPGPDSITNVLIKGAANVFIPMTRWIYSQMIISLDSSTSSKRKAALLPQATCDL